MQYSQGRFEHHPPKLNPDFVRTMWRDSTSGRCNHGLDEYGEMAFSDECTRCVYGVSGVLFLNAFRETQGFGGHEEGGWWFDVGEALASIPVRTVMECLAAYELLWTVFQSANTGYGKFSAAGGSDLGIWLETRFARDFPENRPHYE